MAPLLAVGQDEGQQLQESKNDVLREGSYTHNICKLNKG